MNTIVIGSGHAGSELKESLKQALSSSYCAVDVGTGREEPIDYPGLAALVAQVLNEHQRVRKATAKLCVLCRYRLVISGCRVPYLTPTRSTWRTCTRLTRRIVRRELIIHPPLLTP